jgi:outer membrane protein TolC
MKRFSQAWILTATVCAGSPAKAQEIPAAAADGTLTLQEARELIAPQALAVQAAEARIDEAETLGDTAGSLWRPSIDVRGIYTLNDDRIEVTFPNPYEPLAPWLQTVSALSPELPDPSVLTSAPDTVLVSQLQHDVRGLLTVTQPVYQPLYAPVRRQADAALAASEAGRDLAAWQVLDGVEMLWFEAVRWLRVRDAAAQNLALAELNRERAQRALDNGVGQAFDIDRAQVAVLQAQQNRDSADALYRIQRDAIANLLNCAPNFEIEIPEAIDASAVLAERPESFAGRPEVRLARAQSDVARASGDTALARFLPVVQVSGTVTPHTVTDFQDDVVDWYIQGVVAWNVWDGGTRRAEADRLDAQAARLEWEALLAQNDLDARRRQGEIRVQEAQLRTRQAQEQADLAEAAHARTEQAWQTGAASRLDVDTALQAWLTARLQVAVAEVDVQSAAYALQRLR